MEQSNHYKKLTLKDGSEIALLGTAHISLKSAEEVEEAFNEFKPTTMCVELDNGRYESIYNNERWKNLDIVQVLKQKKGFLLIANLVLSSYQKRMSKLNNTEAGLEMKTACNLARNNNLELSLCDREVSITLRRAWSMSSFWSKNKLISALFLSIFEDTKISEEDLAKMKEASELSVMMEDLAKEAPKIKEVLLDERDAYLAKKIYSSKGSKRLAVLGAAHLNGVEKLIKELDNGLIIDEEKLCELKKPSIFSQTMPYIIPAIIMGMIGYSFVKIGFDGGLEAFKTWFIVNSIPSAIGTVIALGNPLVVALAFVSAPFTSLNPMIGVGMLTGMLQVMLNKPRVSDFESLLDDCTIPKKYYTNRILHALNVFVLSSLGSSIGTWIGLGGLIEFLTKSV